MQSERPRDIHGTTIPSIIVDVGYLESIDSLMEAALQYFENQHVQMLISVKLTGERRRIDEMVAIVLDPSAEVARKLLRRSASGAR